MLTGTLRTALLLSVSVLAACKSGGPSNEGEHWMVDSVPQRMVKHFTGYRWDMDGRYIDFQYQKKKDISRTVRRHFLNNSPDSPFEADDPSQTSRRPPHSPAPDPLYYFGAESIFVGVSTLAISGAFIPLPIDSVVATVFGGWGEFGRGFTEGADAEAETPPSPGRFKVKNR